MAPSSPLLPLAAFIIYGVLLAIYRLTLHPLAKFPGPKLTASTKWWEFYVDVLKGEGGGFIHEMARMHREYGPVVRINPDEIHVSDPSWIDAIYTGPGPIRDKYRPAAHMSGVPLGTFGTISHHTHRLRRSAVKTFISKRTVRTAQTSIRETVEQLCEWLRRHADKGETFDASLPYLAWSTDSVFMYLEDMSPGMLQDVEQAKDWKRTIKTVVDLTPIVKQIPLVMPLVLHVPPWLMRIISKDLLRVLMMHKRMKVSATTAHDEHAARVEGKRPGIPNSVKPDLYQAILGSSLPDQEKEPNRVSQEVLTLLVGGSSTSSRTMTRLTFHLASEPAIMARLREELNSVMPEQSHIPRLEQLESLTYLKAVIKEAIRISTAVSARLPLVSPNEAITHNGWIIPAGTPISMTPLSILTDPTIFTDPYEFQPERWLGDTRSQAHLDKSFIPFGRGTRMCVGMNFAWAELTICAATIFRRFEFELCEDIDRARDVDVRRDCFLGEPSRASRGVRVKVKRSIN